MRKKKSKLVLLFSPIAGTGHLDSWMRLTSLALLDAGYDVANMSPNNSIPSFHPGVRVVPFSLYSTKQQLERLKVFLIYEWVELGRKYTNKLPSSFSKDSDKSYKKVQKKIFRAFIPYLYKISEELRVVKNFDLKRNYYIDEFFEKINNAANYLGRKPDLVINMYLDFYDFEPQYWSNAKERQKFKWTGFLFGLKGNEMPGFMGMESFKGAWILNDHPAYEDIRRLKGDGFIRILPDITDHRVASVVTDELDQIIFKANNRKVVLMAGSISSRKNIPYWLDLIRSSDPSRWYFVLVGQILKSEFSASEYAQLLSLGSDSSSNFCIVNGYISDESNLNKFFEICDVIFAVYKNFPNSSNMLSKAAVFKKPILVSKNSYMGSQVEKYHIGHAVSEVDHLDALGALELILQNEVNYDFESYVSDNSPKKFNTEINALVSHCTA